MRARDKRTAIEKNQVLMFYLLGENSEKPQGVASKTPPPHTSEG